jgi:multidrug efflux system membrane fusion protein
VKPQAGALLLISLAALAACTEGNGAKKAEPAPVPVTAAQATENDVPVNLQVVGRAEAYESVVLKARVDGQVAAVLFSEGQHVKQGDILIRLDPADFTARLHQASATAARDEALQAKTRADTARYTALKERKFVSEEKVNDVRTSEVAAMANLRASKAAEELARLQLSYASIRAPFSGIVGARLVFPGSSVKVNETILAVVNRIRPLLVTFSMPEKHLPRLREAMKSGNLRVNVSLPGDTSQHFAGKVSFIDNAVDPTTGTILMKATLPNEDEKLTSGQFLNVSLTLNTLTSAVTVPNEAIQQGADGHFVYVIKADQSVEMRKIETAASSTGLTAVSKGIARGETVVTDGQLRLAPGVKVKAKAPAESDATPSKQ